jgi:hypothetical protein
MQKEGTHESSPQDQVIAAPTPTLHRTWPSYLAIAHVTKSVVEQSLAGSLPLHLSEEKAVRPLLLANTMTCIEEPFGKGISSFDIRIVRSK